MDISGILSQLKDRLAKVDQSIIAMERLADASGMKRRGRPPAWLKAEQPPSVIPAPEKRRGRPPKHVAA